MAVKAFRFIQAVREGVGEESVAAGRGVSFCFLRSWNNPFSFFLFFFYFFSVHEKDNQDSPAFQASLIDGPKIGKSCHTTASSQILQTCPSSLCSAGRFCNSSTKSANFCLPGESWGVWAAVAMTAFQARQSWVSTSEAVEGFMNVESVGWQKVSRGD